MTGPNNRRLNRLRAWFLGLAVLVVFAGAVVPLTVTFYLQSRVDQAQFDITCTSARSNISQLRALREIARELGIPATFPIPEIPAECEP